MENDLVGLRRRLLDAPGHRRRHASPPAAPSRCCWPCRPPATPAPTSTRPAMVLPDTAHAAFHKAAHYFGVEAGWCRSAPTSAPTSPRPRRGARRLGDRTVLRGGQRAVVRPRGGRPGHRAGRPRRRARPALPRRRLHRRVGAAVRRPAGPRRAAVDLRRRGRHLDLGRPAQVRLRPQGRLAAAAPHRRRSGGRSSSRSAAWPGYTMLNSTMQSTRSGGPLAGAWAVVQSIGDDGLRGADPRGVRGGRRRSWPGPPTSPGCALVVAPDSTLVALATDATCDPFTVCDEMAARGWYVQPQLSLRRAARHHPPLGERRDAARTCPSCWPRWPRPSPPRWRPGRSGRRGRGGVRRRARPGHPHRRRLRRAARRRRAGRRGRRRRAGAADPDGRGQRAARPRLARRCARRCWWRSSTGCSGRQRLPGRSPKG